MDRRRFQHPCSEMVWAAIMTLDAGPQHEILSDLASLYARSLEHPKTNANKVRAAVSALREAAVITGRSPSIKEYRALRESLPELGLPADGSVRRWLGGEWNVCLTRSLLDAVSDGDFASRPFGVNDRFDDEEVFAALRECVSEMGRRPSVSAYFSWARRPDVRERPGRRPLSLKPFERFGGLRGALVAAGLLTENAGRYSESGHVLPLRYAYDDNDIKDALLLVATRLEHSPKPAEYQSERLRIHAERETAGDLKTIPTVEVVRTRYGVWNAALTKAGLAPVKERRQPALGLSSPLYSESEKLEWIRRAWTDCGEPFTQASYKRWRENRMKLTDETIPGVGILVRAFGGWQNARARALPGHPAPRQ